MLDFSNPMCYYAMALIVYALLAQLDRAFGYGPKGQEFVEAAETQGVSDREVSSKANFFGNAQKRSKKCRRRVPLTAFRGKRLKN